MWLWHLQTTYIVWLLMKFLQLEEFWSLPYCCLWLKTLWIVLIKQKLVMKILNFTEFKLCKSLCSTDSWEFYKWRRVAVPADNLCSCISVLKIWGSVYTECVALGKLHQRSCLRWWKLTQGSTSGQSLHQDVVTQLSALQRKQLRWSRLVWTKPYTSCVACVQFLISFQQTLWLFHTVWICTKFHQTTGAFSKCYNWKSNDKTLQLGFKLKPKRKESQHQLTVSSLLPEKLFFNDLCCFRSGNAQTVLRHDSPQN